MQFQAPVQTLQVTYPSISSAASASTSKPQTSIESSIFRTSNTVLSTSVITEAFAPINTPLL